MTDVTSSERVAIPGLQGLTGIGHGRNSIVYRGEQAELNRTVAVKLAIGADPTGHLQRRFRLELLAMGRLSGHPHVVMVHSTGFTEGGQPFMIMEHLPGGSAEGLLHETEFPDWRQVTRIGIQLASALVAAHSAHILHGDVKPSSVLISEDGDAKLAGFGSPPFEGEVGGAESSRMQTIAHTAPEILAGGPASVAGDIYALASTLYTLLAGRAPFAEPGDGAEVALNRAISEPLVRPRGQKLPDGVFSVLERALAADPAQRHPTALDLALHLQRVRVKEGEAVVDMGLGAGQLGDAAKGAAPTRWRRRRLLVLAVAAVVVLSAGGTAFAVFRPGGTGVASAALSRWYDPTISDRWETTGTAGPGYVKQQVLGYVATGPLSGGHAVYACLYGADHFLSADPNCEGYPKLGSQGFAYTTPPPGVATAPLYRCWTTDQRDHFVSNDPYCEGQTLYGLLGYALQSP